MVQKPPFIIFALPRSRTLWLSKFLSYRDWRCDHEAAMRLRSIADIRDYFSRPNRGCAETAAGPGWPLLKYYAPHVSTVVVRRPLDETVSAMLEAGRVGGVTYDEGRLYKVMAYGNRMLDQISDQRDTLTVAYNDLKSWRTCAQIFERCLPYEFDAKWWRQLKCQNIQVNLRRYFEDYFKVRHEIEDFKSLCKRDLFRLVRSGEVRHA